jgi:hypothetical protein
MAKKQKQKQKTPVRTLNTDQDAERFDCPYSAGRNVN